VSENRTERTNVPGEPLRWSVLAATREFNIHRDTLAKRFSEADIKPGNDGLYSTAQILTALNGDIEGEKLRKLRLTNEREELKNAQLRCELAPLKEVSSALQATVLAIRSQILSAHDIPDDRKDSLLSNLKELKPWTQV
jgi:hypothetical protein